MGVCRRWEEDQTFSDIKVNRIESAEIIDGVWYLVIKGDYTGRVKGTVYDLTDPEVPVAIQLEAKWEKCRLPSSTTTEVATATRKVRVHPCITVMHAHRPVASNGSATGTELSQ